MKQIWCVVLALTLLLGLIASSSLHASSPEPKIVFLGKDYNVYVTGIDGKNPRRITSSGQVSHARWLDADTVVTLVRYDTDDPDMQGEDIWLVQTTGKDKKVTRLTKSGNNGSFACSPDGKWIVFTGEPGLCRINRDGSGFRVLRRSQDPDLRADRYAEGGGYPVVAKDAVFYSAFSFTANRYKIWKLDHQSKEDRCIYTSPADEIMNLFSSRDGRRIVFSVVDRGQNTFYVRETNTSDFRTRTLAELKPSDNIWWELCAFMPSEEQALFACTTSSGTDIFVLDLKPGAKPDLLIRNAFAADVWYPGK